ncbi:hypothetical protein, partial [Mycobacterium avium]|uniref:hypothetical protein n=1 Tax=Mycobacterium avium TaxID=1764 RepID=UPI001E2E2354
MSTCPTCSADASRLGNVPTSSAGAAGGRGDDDVGAGLADAVGPLDDGVADLGWELLLPSTTSVITNTVVTVATAPATHHGQRRGRGDGGYQPGGMPGAPAR